MTTKTDAKINEELRESLYRSGYITQLIGFLFYLASLFSFTEFQERLFTLSAYLVIGLGLILTSSFLRVSKKRVKQAAIALSSVGLVLFILFFTLNLLLAAEVSFGLVLAAGAILYGKEAHCYNYKEGTVLMFLFPVVVILSIANLYLPQVALFKHAAWILTGITVASFVLKKTMTPLTKQPH